MPREFHYYTGEIVCVGDHVRVNRHMPLMGHVAEVEMPGTEQAFACNCPEGYVCTITTEDRSNASFLWTPPDGEFWEDLQFVRRANEPG